MSCAGMRPAPGPEARRTTGEPLCRTRERESETKQLHWQRSDCWILTFGRSSAHADEVTRQRHDSLLRGTWARDWVGGLLQKVRWQSVEVPIKASFFIFKWFSRNIKKKQRQSAGSQWIHQFACVCLYTLKTCHKEEIKSKSNKDKVISATFGFLCNLAS